MRYTGGAIHDMPCYAAEFCGTVSVAWAESKDLDAHILNATQLKGSSHDRYKHNKLKYCGEDTDIVDYTEEGRRRHGPHECDRL